MIKKLGLVLSAVLLLSLISGCSSTVPESAPQTTESDETVPSVQTTNTNQSVSSAADLIDTEFTANDMDIGYDESTAVHITLSQDGTTISSNGAAVSNNNVVIASAGTYILSGTLSDGSITVDAADTDKIKLVFNNVNIHSSGSAAMYIKSADKVFITLAEGSINTLSDSAGYTQTDGDSTIDGVIYSKADLTINGLGTLNIDAKNKHAIVSKDDLVITGGTFNIESENGGGLHGKDCVKIQTADIAISSASDAIQADNTEDADRGFIYIAGGSFNITTEADALQSQNIALITGGEFDILTAGGSADVSLSPFEDSHTPFAIRGEAQSDYVTEAESDSSTSTKGIKSETGIYIQGGTFTIDSLDDAIHSNNQIVIEGGEFEIATGDDAVHADSSIEISGGSLNISKCYEGLEAKTITVKDGVIDLTASDDGINATDGSQSMAGFAPGKTASDYSGIYFSMSGGIITIDASGDGIDSNGNIYIEGGEVYISGPSSNGDGILDYEGEAVITGGTVIGAGSLGMALGFSDSSTQCSVLYGLSSSAAQSTITLSDSTGSKIASFTPTKSYQCVIVSSPELEIGKTFTLTAGGSDYQITPDSVSFSVNVSGGMGGMGGPGGRGGMTGSSGAGRH